MRRTWVFSRIVLAALFLALAAGMYLNWPATMRWRVPNDGHSLLEFSVENDVLLTCYTPFSNRGNLGTWMSVNFAIAMEKTEARQQRPEILGRDLSTGLPVLTRPFPAPGNSDIITSQSRSGKYVAISDARRHTVTVMNVFSGEMIWAMENTELRNAAFSDDDQYFMMVAGESLQIWNVHKKRQHACITLDSLEMGKVELPQDRNWHQIKRYPDTLFSVSQNNQYLAFSWGYVLNVFELPTMRLIGQASALGSPQFMPDGTLATIEHHYRPLKPVASLFSIQNGQLVRLKDDYVLEPKPHRVIAENSATYLTSQPEAYRQGLPEWVPTWLKEKVAEWMPASDRRWVLTLRSQSTGRPILTRAIRHKEKGPRLMICGTMSQVERESYVESPRFDVLISSDNCWLAKVDEDFIELWPLLTYWRPWYCWVTVAGLMGIAGYFVWHSRSTLIPRATEFNSVAPA